jgi:HflK protein
MAWNEPGSGRDPWNQGSGGGRGGGGGGKPPDLEQLLKRLRARFGRGPKKPPPGGVGLIVLAVLVAGWLGSGFFTVTAQERAVVLQLGKVARIAGPGLGWNLPWPLGDVLTQKVDSVRQVTLQSTLLTRDHSLVDVGLTIQYHISSLEKFLFGSRDPDDVLGESARAALRTVVAGYKVDDVLGNSQNDIASAVKKALQKRLDAYDTGLVVSDLSLSNVQPPEAVQKAFADAIKAADDRAGMKSRAQSYAQSQVPNARGQAAQEIADAKAYRDRVVGQAQGESERFDALLVEYRRAPQLTRERLYTDTMNYILRHNRLVLVDSGKSGNINVTLPRLPAPAASTATPPASSSSAAPSQGQDDKGSESSSQSGAGRGRSRDRGGD